MRIEDGSGKGFVARVTSGQQLAVDARATTLLDSHAFAGYSFMYTSSVVTLGDDSESGLLYVKNANRDRVLYLERFLIALGNSQGGIGDAIWTVYRNPTSGSLVNGAIPSLDESLVQNRNFGVDRDPEWLVNTGGQGQTIMGGDLYTALPLEPGALHQLASGVCLPCGASLAISVQPPSPNTALRVSVAFVAAMVDPGAF